MKMRVFANRPSTFENRTLTHSALATTMKAQGADRDKIVEG